MSLNSGVMSDGNVIDGFRLQDLNPLYGREVSYVKSNDNVRIEAIIFACEDLIIEDDIEVEFLFPLNYPNKGGMQVFTNSPEVFKHTAYYTQGSRQLIINSFESARYPIGVWFFMLRIPLKKNLDPWITPFELCRSLPLHARQLEGGNVQRVEMIAGAGRTRGRRSYMEDMDYIFDNIRVSERASIASFGVLDGHGGAECAKFAVDDIPMKIASNLRSGLAHSEALFRAFLATDAEFLKAGRSTAGSTACVMAWDRAQGVAFMANTGDTRAVLCRSGRAVELTRDKKATDNSEIARICIGGGFVVNGRVLGSLAVSRALGDGQLKQPGKRTVIADPDITAFRPNATSVLQSSGNIQMEVDEFIIIATDGLWDVFSSQQAVNFAREQLDKAGLLPDGNGASDLKLVGNAAVSTALSQIGEVMANHAVKSGSLDNVTVMIIRILVGEPDAEVPSSGRLEGWQWEAPYSGSVGSNDAKKGGSAKAGSGSGSGSGSTKNNGNNNDVVSSSIGSSKQSLGKSASSGAVGGGSSAVGGVGGDELDFLYNDPMFAPTPERKGQRSDGGGGGGGGGGGSGAEGMTTSSSSSSYNNAKYSSGNTSTESVASSTKSGSGSGSGSIKALGIAGSFPAMSSGGDSYQQSQPPTQQQQPSKTGNKEHASVTSVTDDLDMDFLLDDRNF